VNEHSPAAAFPDHITITGLGLTLREWTDADIPAMAELFDDPDVDRFTPLRAPFDLAAARAYLQTARQTRAEGGRLQLAITTDGHTPQGEILLFRARGSDLTPDTADTADTAELAYAIGPRPPPPTPGHSRRPAHHRLRLHHPRIHRRRAAHRRRQYRQHRRRPRHRLPTHPRTAPHPRHRPRPTDDLATRPPPHRGLRPERSDSRLIPRGTGTWHGLCVSRWKSAPGRLRAGRASGRRAARPVRRGRRPRWPPPPRAPRGRAAPVRRAWAGRASRAGSCRRLRRPAGR
jgi:Acetyltransferase (GNAT) domain